MRRKAKKAPSKVTYWGTHDDLVQAEFERLVNLSCWPYPLRNPRGRYVRLLIVREGIKGNDMGNGSTTYIGAGCVRLAIGPRVGRRRIQEFLTYELARCSAGRRGTPAKIQELYEAALSEARL